MEIKDTKQLDFLIALESLLNEYKKSSFQIAIDITGKLYIPVNIVNAHLTTSGKEACTDLSELVESGYVKTEEDDYTREAIVTITRKGIQYIDTYGLG